MFLCRYLAIIAEARRHSTPRTPDVLAERSLTSAHSGLKWINIGCREICRLTKQYLPDTIISQRLGHGVAYHPIRFEEFTTHAEVYLSDISTTLGITCRSNVYSNTK